MRTSGSRSAVALFWNGQLAVSVKNCCRTFSRLNYLMMGKIEVWVTFQFSSDENGSIWAEKPRVQDNGPKVFEKIWSLVRTSSYGLNFVSVVDFHQPRGPSIIKCKFLKILVLFSWKNTENFSIFALLIRRTRAKCSVRSHLTILLTLKLI